MKKQPASNAQVTELLYQALETELGGVEIYRTALQCVVNQDLAREWRRYLEETEHHVEVVRGMLEAMGLDPETDTPGRAVVRHIGASLCKAMQMAKGGDEAEAAELVAAECVTLAETKDHLNWQLLRKVSESDAAASKQLAAGVAEVEDEEDEHLYHTAGWARELWLQALDVAATLPPPEEEQEVRSMAQAAKAKERHEEA